MGDFFPRVAIRTVRFFGTSYGALLLLLSPFAFDGTLASEAVDPPSSATNFIVGFRMAWVGATLLVPFRFVKARRVWVQLLTASYAVSVALLLVEGASTGDVGLRVALWQIVFVALNVAGLIYLHHSGDPDGA